MASMARFNDRFEVTVCLILVYDGCILDPLLLIVLDIFIGKGPQAQRADGFFG
jgi:hypothetical protein